MCLGPVLSVWTFLSLPTGPAEALWAECAGPPPVQWGVLRGQVLAAGHLWQAFRLLGHLWRQVHHSDTAGKTAGQLIASFLCVSSLFPEWVLEEVRKRKMTSCRFFQIFFCGLGGIGRVEGVLLLSFWNSVSLGQCYKQAVADCCFFILQLFPEPVNKRTFSSSELPN